MGFSQGKARLLSMICDSGRLSQEELHCHAQWNCMGFESGLKYRSCVRIQDPEEGWRFLAHV